MIADQQKLADLMVNFAEKKSLEMMLSDLSRSIVIDDNF